MTILSDDDIHTYVRQGNSLLCLERENTETKSDLQTWRPFSNCVVVGTSSRIVSMEANLWSVERQLQLHFLVYRLDPIAHFTA